MWQVFCVNTAARDALLHVARTKGWDVPKKWPADYLWLLMEDAHVGGDDVPEDGIEVTTLHEAFELIDKGPCPVAHFEDFDVCMTVDQAKKVLTGDKSIMDELFCTLEGVSRTCLLTAIGQSDFDWGGCTIVQNNRRVIWLAACKILSNYYLGDRNDADNNHN